MKLEKVSGVRTYYPLPEPGLRPTGIAQDADGRIWVLAATGYVSYLPAVQSQTASD